jgi:hypothetical protein
MGRSSGDGYSLTELFIVKFVLADIVIVAALIFAGPVYAVLITALLVLSVVLLWYLVERVGTDDSDERAEPEPIDPVTTLQNRYAAGDLSEAEFESRLDQLIDANERANRADVETEELSLER